MKLFAAIGAFMLALSACAGPALAPAFAQTQDDFSRPSCVTPQMVIQTAKASGITPGPIMTYRGPSYTTIATWLPKKLPNADTIYTAATPFGVFVGLATGSCIQDHMIISDRQWSRILGKIAKVRYTPKKTQEQTQELDPESWGVVVDAKAEGHGGPVFYSLSLFPTKEGCEAFKASPEWTQFYREWAKYEIEAHDGKIDFGPAPYCAQLKTLRPYDDTGSKA